MEHKAESANVGCKVLPMCDAAPMGSTGSDSGNGSYTDIPKGERRRAMSRMKEMLRWAAAVKYHKGESKGWKVMYFRNRVALRPPLDDLSSTSDKVSLEWDVGSCSTTSMYSPLSVASASNNRHLWTENSTHLALSLKKSECDSNTLGSPKTEEYVRTGQWITTNSDFVVLEL